MRDKIEGPADNTEFEGLINDDNATQSQAPDSLNLIDLNSFESGSEDEWLLEHAIPSGYYTGLYGEGGMGKSYVANYLGILACIGGQTFCGLNFPERRINSLLIDYELNPDQQKKRLAQICSGHGLSSIPENFLYAQPRKLIKPLLPEIIEYVRSQNIEFIILDSLAVAGVDPLDVNKFISFTHQLAELKVTCLIIDHQAKQQAKGNYGEKSAYGTVYKRNLARSEFQILRTAASENVISMEMVHKKTNFGQKLDPLNFKIVFGESTITFEEQSIINPYEQDSTFIVNAIRNLQAQGRELIQTDILTELNGTFSKNRILDLLDKGEGLHWIVRRGERNSKIYELIEPEN